jgi:hypothetical protein
MRPKKVRQVIIFFDIKGPVFKEFVLAGQTVNSAYYCDVLWRMREITSPQTLATKELVVA